MSTRHTGSTIAATLRSANESCFEARDTIRLWGARHPDPAGWHPLTSADRPVHEEIVSLPSSNGPKSCATIRCSGHSSGGVRTWFRARQDSTRSARTRTARRHGVQHLLAEHACPFGPAGSRAYASARRQGDREHSQGTFVRAGVRDRFTQSSTTVGSPMRAAIQDAWHRSLTRAQMDQNLRWPPTLRALALAKKDPLQPGSTCAAQPRLGPASHHRLWNQPQLYIPITLPPST